MTELKGPAASEIKNFIKQKTTVEFHLINDKILTGQIIWHDEDAFHVQTEEHKVITILQKAVLYYSKVR